MSGKNKRSDRRPRVCKSGEGKAPLIRRLRPRYALWLGLGAALTIGGILVYGISTERMPVSPAQPPIRAARYVGGKACAVCHAKEYEAWRGSHHDLAMQEANEKTILGNFANSKFDYGGVTSTFFKRNGRFFVNTDGSDGKLADYEIKYTFGVTPLQQYLIQFPGGRMQALGIAWDSRPKERGGRRWFHLYPKENIRAGDPLHWTGIDQNWNHQCAECHSTNLQKHYDARQAVYHTTWSEINVACEACHGPGGAHIEWARKTQEPKKTSEHNGLVVQLTERRGIRWVMEETRGIAHRSAARTTSIEINICARCHSRRGVLTENYLPGKPLLDTHLPALLTEGLYYPDGQIQGEVYEYGSFLQSKMYAAGVTCSDCHEPHSLKLRVQGDSVCSQCHLPAKFASVEHSHHRLGSPGASCQGCHMPERVYMVVDPRRDHSFRIPRPDLSAKFGSPNACNGCHTSRSVAWAANAFEKWHKPAPSQQQRYAEALYAGRSGQPGAEAGLIAVAREKTIPAIARATALAEVRRYLSPKSLAVLEESFRDPDPLIRLGALRAVEGVDPLTYVTTSIALLRDPIRAVRSAAAALFAGVGDAFSPAQKAALDRAVQEYVVAQTVNADRPEAHLNLGLLYVRSGRFDKAEEEYQEALKLQPSFAPAYVNLTDLYRVQARDKAGERLLRKGVKVAPDDGSIAHTLGLLLVREKRLAEALPWLKRAVELEADNARYAYVYGVALNSAGNRNKALDVLTTAEKRHSYDRDLLYALATINRDAGRKAAARSYAERLVAVAPNDSAAKNLLKKFEH